MKKEIKGMNELLNLIKTAKEKNREILEVQIPQREIYEGIFSLPTEKIIATLYGYPWRDSAQTAVILK